MNYISSEGSEGLTCHVCRYDKYSDGTDRGRNPVDAGCVDPGDVGGGKRFLKECDGPYLDTCTLIYTVKEGVRK